METSKYFFYQKGFSLLGVIIAIFIISLALAAALGLVSYSLQAAAASKADLIASGLAQEGIEAIRFWRESQPNWADWYGAVADGSYRVQYDQPAPLEFADVPLKIDANGFYQYSSGQDTPFYRQVVLTKISDLEVKVASEVKWHDKEERLVTAEDRLWNWK